MKASELRQKYLDFFKSKKHAIIPSASLIPENDPTTLFTASGMQPMVPYLLDEKHPEGTRIADSQKCFRTIELDENTIGDNRHTTFFEMLGNWSLGDYFKKEQIEWMFEFLTKEIKLDPKRIYVSIYRGNEKIGIPRDEEAVKIWQEQFNKVGIDAKAVDMAEEKGMQDGDRIFYYNEEENWWSRAGVPENMPIGEPGGPDSEMFWDFGEHLKIHENSPYKHRPCSPSCSCGRFLEIGNNVFMQYIKTKDGFEELENKNIDFGGGLERLVAASIDEPDIFKIDLFDLQRKKLEGLTGKKYGESEEETKHFRVILDHLRAATFLIGDGVFPSNKDQGYFIRRLIRRAIRFGYQLGIKENFTSEIGKAVIKTYEDYYTNLKEKQGLILSEFKKEEEKFRKTLIRGRKELKRMIQGIKESDKPHRNFLFGEEAFYLYESYGLPLEFIEDLCKDFGFMKIPKKDFYNEMKKHQELSRTASAGKFKGGLADNKEETMQLHTTAHLLLAGLRKVLGDHVYQKGSNITPERLRFDFSHPKKMTDEEKQKVEDFVNDVIGKRLDICCEELELEKAKEQGAMGVFENKYGERVKVYTVGDEEGREQFSKEICGGPHVANTGYIKGKFKIKKEKSSSAGVRRIKAVLEV